jgi:hypothetical protein
MMATPTPVAINRLELGIAPYRASTARGDRCPFRRAAPNVAGPLEWALAVAGGVLRGTLFRDRLRRFHGVARLVFPRPFRRQLLCHGALRASDGAYLLGVMSAFTANAGRIYFPAGTPDPSDISGDTVDLLGRVLRELEEETGLGTQDLSTPPDWIAIVTGARLALIKPVAAKAGAGSAAGGAAPSRGRNWRTSGSCARPLISIPPCLIS